jgi:uncharacterized membrane protein YhaH (DUF805 family)
MDFKTAVMTCLQKYADFSGRARRSEYWWFFLFQILVIGVLSIVLSILGTLVSLALLIPAIAVGARRLHDVGRSGWWMLIGFIPLIGLLVLLYWGTQEGEAEANAWGAPPA